MNILHLTLHREFFDQIAARTKRIEYRADTAYWRRRLLTPPTIEEAIEGVIGEFQQFDAIHFTNGYGKHRPFMRVEHISTDFGDGPFGHGFQLHLGEILEIKNYKPVPLI